MYIHQITNLILSFMELLFGNSFYILCFSKMMSSYLIITRGYYKK